MKLLPDLIDLLAELAAAGVRYLVVGGHAVGAHARPRATKDLDLWLESSPRNVARAADALTTFRAPPNVVDALRRASADDIIWLGKPPGRVDLLLSLPALEFEAAWPNRIEIQLGSLTVPVIGREDLIRNKEAVGRPQDRRDVRALRGASSTRTRR
jgi:hypothetical protein